LFVDLVPRVVFRRHSYRFSFSIAQKRNEAKDDPRKAEITTQNLQYERKVDDLRVKLEDDRVVLESLRDVADGQSEIAVLQEQCDREFEALEESLRDEASSLQRFNLQPAQPLPKGDEDDNGESLVEAVQSICKSIDLHLCRVKVAILSSMYSHTIDAGTII